MAIAELNDRGLFVVYGGRNVVYGPAGEKCWALLTDTWVGYYKMEERCYSYVEKD